MGYHCSFSFFRKHNCSQYSNCDKSFIHISNTPAVDLGSIVIKEALNRSGVPADQVDEVLMGCVIQAGLGQNVARQASVKAGIPVEVPAVTINVVCGSGLNSVNMAADMILAGDADIVVAGGMENMSMAPFCLPKARFGYRMNNGVLVDCMIKDALWDAFNDYHMIKTADNVAEKFGLTRREIDEFAAWSQTKCAKAMEEGKFKDEIVPVTVKQKKQEIVFDKDEGPRGAQTARCSCHGHYERREGKRARRKADGYMGCRRNRRC